MRIQRLRTLAWVIALGAVLPQGVTAQQGAKRFEHSQGVDGTRARFTLAASPTTVLSANQFQCGLDNLGNTCVDIFGSPTGGGGFWPTGSPNQYMFNSGIMIAGIVPEDAGFAWAGDTTGAYFMDARGTQAHGQAITNIYNSLNPDDLANWPSEGSVPGFDFASAFIRDGSIFNPVLLDRKFGSQQDTWVMYWDGDPALSANRDHPMGVAIEQRTMAWNFPSGNEATIFIFYKITNVTDNPTFQQLNETRYGLELPDAGWAIDSLYLAYDADQDVSSSGSGENFGTVVLPFNMGITYHSLFAADEFSYPPSLFFPPFFTQAPGIVGVQYLKSPVDPSTGEEVGLTMFSIHENPGTCTGLCDPLGVKQLWRYISGNVNPGLGDPSCTFANPRERRICYLPQVSGDVRSFQASGPFTLGAGESTTIVVAMMAAATVQTPEITIGAENPPGVPGPQPGCDDAILPIEVAAGWLNTPATLCDATPEGEALDLREVQVVPGSLLGRAQVAQAVFDGQFLLPFAPDPPDFYLVPGDNQVTVVWAASSTETVGDPFFEAAQGDPTSPLYNPNYRQFDVEGYRIYKSTDNATFEAIAQFDYANTTFTDLRCEADRTFVAGVDDEADCEETVYGINDVTDVNADFVNDPFVLFGGANAQRLRLSDGRTLAVQGDTATPGTLPDLTDNGVPFGFVDTDVRNGFRYFYQVRAFDINSTFSGPISLESSSDTKSAIPQAAAPNQQLASFTLEMQGADGVVLDPDADLPVLDEQDGTFSGPMPPTNSLEAVFIPLVERLLPEFSLTWRMDSVIPYYNTEPECDGIPSHSLDTQGCWQMHVTLTKDGVDESLVVTGFTPSWASFTSTPTATEFVLGSTAIDADPESLEEFGAPNDFLDLQAGISGFFEEAIYMSSWEGQLTRRLGVEYTPGGSRWFSGENETQPDPGAFIGVGSVAEADTVWAPIHHTATGPGQAAYPNSGFMQYFGYQVAWLFRAADFELVWNADGTVTVTDVTHQLPVEFKPDVQASYGFLTQDADGDGIISWWDFFGLEGVRVGATANIGWPAAAETELTETAALVDVTTADPDFGSATTPTGTGFGLYINGERYIFQMDALPPAGTTWTLRTYAGRVESDEASAESVNPSGYAFTSEERPPMVPGLSITFQSEARTQLVGSEDLSLIHTVPDPYYAQSRYDLSPVERALRFVNLPSEATIRIYTVSGLLVDVLNHNDPAAGGLATWDLRNRSGQFVASGVYFYHVATPEGQERIGRFTVITSGIGQ